MMKNRTVPTKAQRRVAEITPEQLDKLHRLYEQNQAAIFWAINRCKIPDTMRSEAESVAAEGLWLACLGFEEEKGFSFMTYLADVLLRRLSNWRLQQRNPMCMTGGLQRRIYQARDKYVRMGVADVEGIPRVLPITYKSEDDDEEKDMSLVSRKDTAEDTERGVDLTELIEKVKRSLTPRESDIFFLYHLHDMTLEEISKQFHVTRERVRQILKTIVEKLRRRLPEYAC